MKNQILRGILGLGTGGLLGLSLIMGTPILDSASARDDTCERGPSPQAQSAHGYSLFFALDLSPEQIENLKAVLGTYHDGTQGTKASLESLRTQQERIYGSMAKDLKKKGEVSTSDQAAYNTIQGEMKTLREDLRERSKGSAKAVADILTDEQREILGSYHPSVALGGLDSPPKRERREGKGEASNSRGEHHAERMEAKLDLARYSTPEQVEKRRAQLVERAVEKGMTPEEAKAMGDEVAGIILEMQTLSDEEWEASKSDYGERLKAASPRHGGKAGKGHRGKGPSGKAHKAARLILNPGFYDALLNAS